MKPRSEGATWLRCIIELLDTQTGETVGFEDCGSIWLDEGQPNDFMWGEGNYACDCNRFLMFERALGREPDLHLDNCGSDRYLAKAIRLDTGEVVFDEIA